MLIRCQLGSGGIGKADNIKPYTWYVATSYSSITIRHWHIICLFISCIVDPLVENLLVQKQQYNYLRRNTSQGASPQKNDFMLEFLNTFE